MRSAHSLMQHPPAMQLSRGPGLASRHPPGSFAIYAHSERAAIGERQIERFDAQLVMGSMTTKDHGAGAVRAAHAPFYPVELKKARNKSKSPVPDKKFSYKTIFVYFSLGHCPRRCH